MAGNVEAATPFTPAVTTPSQAAARVGDAAVELATAVRRAGGGVSAALPSTDLTPDLNNLDFKQIIGTPLQAAIEAQIASSVATVDFIRKVGYKAGEDGKPTDELVMANFDYKKTTKDGTTEGSLSVPLLSLILVPSLRIEELNLDFNVKLNSVQKVDVTEKLGVDASLQAGWGPVNFKVSASYQRQTTTGVEVKKEYSLTVNVKAVQDEMPAGLEKVLGLLAA